MVHPDLEYLVASKGHLSSKGLSEAGKIGDFVMLLVKGSSICVSSALSARLALAVMLACAVK